VVDYRRNFELFVIRIESFIWSFFTVKGIVSRFRFLQSIRYTPLNDDDMIIIITVAD
jgi:hypothetical protein